MKPKTYAIILAGGSGKRLQSSVPKAFVMVHNKSIIEHSIMPFQLSSAIHHIILVVPADYVDSCMAWIPKYSKICKVVAGGCTRYHSSQNGLVQVPNMQDKVLIHDAARPFVDADSIAKCVDALDKYEAVNLLSPVSNSMVSMQNNRIQHAVDREAFRQVLTPQAFIKKCLHQAHQKASALPQNSITDDFDLVLHFATGSTTWVEGKSHNIKITYPHDLKIANCLLT